MRGAGKRRVAKQGRDLKDDCPSRDDSAINLTIPSVVAHGLAQGGPGAMKPGPRRDRRDPKRLGGGFGGLPLHMAKEKNRAQPFGQGIDGVLQAIAQLLAMHALVRPLELASEAAEHSAASVPGSAGW